MAILSLGYIGIRSNKLTDWADFSTSQLGMSQLDNAGKNLSFRMDNYKQRFVVIDEPGNALGFLGWEVENAQDLNTLAAAVESTGTSVEIATRSLCDRRFVTDMILFDDPDGNRIELFYGPMIDKDPFRSGRPISGFKTGPYGMGHAVLHARDVEALLLFYRDTLGFSVSDYGLSPYPMYFFHVNGRHHSFAVIGTGQSGFHHFMVEYNNLDDVGQGYDIAQLADDRIAYTLGRHTNDYMTSFYANTPSGFFIESGWGGRIIDQASWQAHETFTGPSFWGHERLHLPEEKRKVLRDMRLKAAQDGLQAPPLVNCPWLYSHRVL
ncbi:biphenyl 2,3-dioxygenase [Chromatiales bacterium (ex Bugula neritina AB1)]|nr:biphenyl 2,3-dioxygenase [Chromatiales bacterium (ex Bugula neritina AB1)]